MNSFPFKSNYLQIDGLSVHYLDEGPKDGIPFLLLHGLPAWCFMYRNIIPVLVQEGYRVVCPDLIGFGKSDQLPKASDYTYDRQFSILNEFILRLELDNLYIYGQDWGAGFALHLGVTNQKTTKAIAISNGLLTNDHLPHPPRLKAWKTFAKYSPFLPIGQIVSWGCRTPLPRSIKKMYALPFKKGRKKAPVRILPHWIPKSADDPIIRDHAKVWNQLKKMTLPVLCLFSEGDKFTRGADDYIIQHIPGCQNQDHQKLFGGHFIQEDSSEEIANLLLKFARKIGKS